MNKIFSFAALVAMFLTISSSDISAQKVMNEGVITMELTDVQSDDPQMAGQLQMLKGSSTVVHFNDAKSLMKMDMMGGMMQMTFLTNTADKTGYLLFDMEMMGKKVKVNINEEDVKKKEEMSENSSMKVTYDKTDVKEIAGYNCYKAEITSADMQGSSISAYVTNEIKVNADVIQGVSADLLDGFPLEYSIGAPGMSMVYTTTKVDFKVDASVFDVSFAGYEEQSMEQFQKSVGAMGGMGF